MYLLELRRPVLAAFVLGESSCESPESPQDPRFSMKKGGFAMDEVAFELGARCFDSRGWRDWTETVDYSTKFLLRSQVPDIIQLRV